MNGVRVAQALLAKQIEVFLPAGGTSNWQDLKERWKRYCGRAGRPCAASQ